MQRTQRIGLWTCAVLAVAASACAGPASPDDSLDSTPSINADPAVRPDDVSSAPSTPSSPIAHPVTEQPVSVEWVDDVDRTLLVTERALRARVTNKTAESMKVNLAALGEGTTETHASYVAQLELAPGEAREVDVALDHVPVQTTSAASPLRLMAVLPELERQIPSQDVSISFNDAFDVAFVSARDALGPTLAAKLHGDVEDPRIVALSEERDALVRPEDLSMLGAEELVPAGRVIEGNAFAPIHALAPTNGLVTLGTSLTGTQLTSLSPAVSSINTNITYVPFPINLNVHLCARWTATFSDSTPWGEDELNEGVFKQVGTGDFTFWVFVYDPVPARFARAYVSNATTGAAVYNGPLDANGCVDLWIPAGRYKMSVETVLQKGGTSYDIRELRPKVIDSYCPTTTMRGYSECDDNGFFLKELSVSRPLNRWETVNATVDSGYATHYGRVAAVAGLMLAKDDGAMVAGKEYRVYANSGCSSFSWKEACADSTAYFGVSIGASPTDTTLDKFVVAHELGHQLEWQRSATKYYTYPVPAGTPELCSCAHVTHGNDWHCLQSRHDFSTAHTEGFAQFVSARTMNDSTGSDCTYTYYKDVKYADGTLLAPPVQTDCATAPRWVATYCPSANTSSEWDLMAYYRALTSGTDALTMDELLRTLSGASYYLTWPSFRDSAATVLGTSSPKYTRLVSLASTYGVNL